MSQEVPIRIILVHPPSGVRFAVQRGKANLFPPAQIDDTMIIFDFTVRVRTRNLMGAHSVGAFYPRFAR